MQKLVQGRSFSLCLSRSIGVDRFALCVTLCCMCSRLPCAFRCWCSRLYGFVFFFFALRSGFGFGFFVFFFFFFFVVFFFFVFVFFFFFFGLAGTGSVRRQ